MFPYHGLGLLIVNNVTDSGLPLVQPIDLEQFFDALYAVLYPAMPFVMLGAAVLLAGYLIVVIRKVFSFESMEGSKEYGYKDKDNE